MKVDSWLSNNFESPAISDVTMQSLLLSIYTFEKQYMFVSLSENKDKLTEMQNELINAMFLNGKEEKGAGNAGDSPKSKKAKKKKAEGQKSAKFVQKEKTDLAEAKKKPQSSKVAPTKTGKSNKQEAGKARVESAVKASDHLFNFMRSLSTEKDSAPTEIVPVSTQTTNAPSRVLDLLDRPTLGSAINFTNFVTDGSLLTNNYTPINSNNTTLNKTVPVLPNTATTTYNSSEKIDTHHVFKPFPLQPVHMEWNNNEPPQP